MDPRQTLLAFAIAGALAMPVDAATGAATPAAIAGPALVEASREVLAVVEIFTAARAARDWDLASALLDPGVVVLVDGRVVGSREDYLAAHAGPAAALRPACPRRLRRRESRAGGSLAWVVSEHERHADRGIECETLVLARSAGGWRILHVHWSIPAA